MVIRVRKKKGSKEIAEYKTQKYILTPTDIEKADRFDDDLTSVIQDIEQTLLKRGISADQRRRGEALEAWHIVGTRINEFLSRHNVEMGDETAFWRYMYGRSPIIHKGKPSGKTSGSRNDFRIACDMAKYPLAKLKRVGTWSMWREVLSISAFRRDKRVRKWAIDKLLDFPTKTKNGIRPFLKATVRRLDRIDTSVLTECELIEKLSELAQGKKAEVLPVDAPR